MVEVHKSNGDTGMDSDDEMDDSEMFEQHQSSSLLASPSTENSDDSPRDLSSGQGDQPQEGGSGFASNDQGSKNAAQNAIEMMRSFNPMNFAAMAAAGRMNGAGMFPSPFMFGGQQPQQNATEMANHNPMAGLNPMQLIFQQIMAQQSMQSLLQQQHSLAQRQQISGQNSPQQQSSSTPSHSSAKKSKLSIDEILNMKTAASATLPVKKEEDPEDHPSDTSGSSTLGSDWIVVSEKENCVVKQEEVKQEIESPKKSASPHPEN
ncbi:hypothetical protein Ddc_12664 [Ditylenchus destructor]|nr:hypothetical protein Ddc_12664 [Ditylenchus destructor]